MSTLDLDIGMPPTSKHQVLAFIWGVLLAIQGLKGCRFGDSIDNNNGQQ